MSLIDGIELCTAGAILLVWSVKVILLVRRGINPFAVGAGKRGLARWVELSMPVLLAIWVLMILGYTLHVDALLRPAAMHARFFDSSATRIIGTACAVAAAVVMTAAMVHFGNAWRVGVAETGTLVTHGVFALSRNPIFLALDLYCIGAFLTYSTPVFLLLAATEVAGVHYQVRQEERFLRDRFGAAYDAYCARTPRYIGWRAGSSFQER